MKPINFFRVHSTQDSPRSFANIVLLYLFIGLALNSIFNSLAVAFGYTFPATSFLFSSADLFADFFNINFAIAREMHVIIDEGGLPTTINNYLINNPYAGVSGISKGGITIFHLPPLTILFFQTSVLLIKIIGGLPAFIFMLTLFYICLLCICRIICDGKLEAAIWFFSAIISYPLLFMVTRGNLIAGFAGILVIASIALVLLNKNKLLAVFFLALATNFRPNLAVFFLLILIVPGKIYWRYVLYAMLFSILTFIASLTVAGHFYPDYSISNFLTGVRIYKNLYIDAGYGLSYGSSLFGALGYIFGHKLLIEVAVYILCGSLLLCATTLYYFSKINFIIYSFLLCSICCLATSIFADYHLVIFLLPLFLFRLISIDVSCIKFMPIRNGNYFLVIFGCLFVLVPKNYAFFGGTVSWQIILNPIILLFTSLCILIFYKNSHSKN